MLMGQVRQIAAVLGRSVATGTPAPAVVSK